MNYFVFFLCALSAIALITLPAYLFAAAVIYISFYILNKKLEKNTLLIRLVVIGFILRIVFSFFNYHLGLIGPYKGTDTQPDALIYNGNAFYVATVIADIDYRKAIAREPFLKSSLAVARSTYKGKLPEMGTYQYPFYVYLLGLFYSWLGYSPFAVKLINCLLGSLSAVLAYFIAKRVIRTETFSFLAAGAVMFFPSLFYWSITSLQDSITIFLFLSYMLSIINWLDKNSFSSCLPVVIITFLLILFESSLAALFVMGTSSIFLLQSLMAILKRRILTRGLILIAIAVILSVLAVKKHYLINYHAEKAIGNILNYHRVSATSYPNVLSYRIYKDALYSNPGTTLKNMLDFSLAVSIFKGYAYYLFSPLPWQDPHSHAGLLFFYPQAIFIILVFPFAVRGALLCVRRDRYMGFAVIFLLILFITPQAMSEAIIGNVVRHRDIFTPFYIIFAAYGLYPLGPRKSCGL